MTDHLPFSELVNSIPHAEKNLDVILVTPGGSGEQVAQFVDMLRPRFDNVAFILPYMAMSAGTIFSMSGNDIIMGSDSYIGPTDPQIPNSHGQHVPAQGLITVIDEIQKRGDSLLKGGGRPLWTDMHILNRIDAKDLGRVINASEYSKSLVKDYLLRYKFDNWTKHSDGRLVTRDEKEERANTIGMALCDHDFWKTHSRGINRETAWERCRLKIVHSESIPDLNRAIRRFWALIYWSCEMTTIFKFFASSNYSLFRNDLSLMK